MVKTSNISKMLTPSDIAKILNVSYDTALNFVKYSGIPYIKIGHQYRVNEAALEAVLASEETLEVTFDEAG